MTNRTTALIAIAITVFTAFCGCKKPANEIQEEMYPATDSTDHNPVPHGIDVSHHNDIEWDQIKDYKQLMFMYAKATEGATYQDDKFDFHKQFAHEHKLMFGGYHFLTTTSSIGEQFVNFKTVIGNCDCLPMLDIEGWRIHQLDTLELQSMVDEWIDSCRHEWNVKPIIYCSAKLHGKIDLRGCPWWVDGETCRNPNNVITPEPKGDYTIWQYSVFKDTAATAQKFREDGSHIGDSIDVNFFRPGLSLKSILVKEQQLPKKP